MELIFPSDKIFVAGHNGLVGSAIVEALNRRGFKNIFVRPRSELDLLDATAVTKFYADIRPDVVFIAAAKVGGILANNTLRADFIYDNLQVQNNVIWGAHKAGVRRLVFLGSSCIYPKYAEQPINESALLKGELEFTNRPYAVAKIAGIELVQSLRVQYGRDYFSVMPTNLYGPRDNYHPENSHVLPGLIRRFHEAKQRGDSEVVVWGTGNPKREFLYSLDCGEAIVHLAQRYGAPIVRGDGTGIEPVQHVNIGTGEDISIAEVASLVGQAVGFKGSIRFDTSKPDGTPRKLLDVGLLNSTGWRSTTPLTDGIQAAYDWFLKNV